MSDPLLPLSSAPSPSLRERVWQAKGKILLGVVLLAIICIKAYWKNDIHPYLQDHPFVWQKGLIILGVAALVLFLGIKYANRRAPVVPLLSEPPIDPMQAPRLPAHNREPLTEEQRVYINAAGERVILSGGWRRKGEWNDFVFCNRITGERQVFPPPAHYMRVQRTCQPEQGDPPTYRHPDPIFLHARPIPAGWELRRYIYLPQEGPQAYYFYNPTSQEFNWEYPEAVEPLNNDEAALLAWIAEQ